MKSDKVAVLSCVIAVAIALPAVAQNEIMRIGQIVPLTGPLSNVGKEITAVTQAAFDEHNAKSTTLKFELVTEDDGNNPERSAAAVTAIAGKTTALLSCFGTVGCMAQMKAAQSAKLPLIGPIAGAAQLRDKQAKFVYAVRASASDELNRLIRFAQTVGFTNLSVAVQDDGFGQGYLATLKPLLEGSGLAIKELALINPKAPDYDAVADGLRKSQTHALLLLANATHSVGVMKAWSAQAPLPFVLNLPGQTNSLFANGLKGYKGGASFATVTPSPWDVKMQIQRDYQLAMTNAKIQNLSYLGFESYINARIAIEAAKRASNRSSAAVAAVLDGGQISVSGWDWKNVDPTQSRYTDLALLRPDGTFRH